MPRHIGGIGDDTIWGDGGNDRIEGGANNDNLNGEAGNVRVNPSYGSAISITSSTGAMTVRGQLVRSSTAGGGAVIGLSR